jgi:hypothetical protein
VAGISEIRETARRQRKWRATEPVDTHGNREAVAKVGVEGSNPFARSRFLIKIRMLRDWSAHADAYIAAVESCCKQSVSVAITKAYVCCTSPMATNRYRRALIRL